MSNRNKTAQTPIFWIVLGMLGAVTGFLLARLIVGHWAELKAAVGHLF